MIRSLFTAATGMIAQQLNLDVIANNLANVNTPGFKRSRADFQDLMYQITKEPGTPSQPGTSPTGIQVGLGVRPESVGKLFTQGDFTSTGNSLDVAIEGEGFFQVDVNGTTNYTRAGNFKLNGDGDLVTADGYLVTPAVNIPSTALSVNIGSDGVVSYIEPGSTTPTEVATMELVRFPNAAGLRSKGKNLYEETESSGSPATGEPGDDGYGTLASGFLESSNVSVVEEIVQMVTGQRAYEANSKVIQTADQLLSVALSVKR